MIPGQGVHHVLKISAAALVLGGLLLTGCASLLESRASAVTLPLPVPAHCI